jgi:hypothetical protein
MKMKNEFFKLCEFDGFGQKLKLLYRGTLHGFSSSMFHARCDNISKTLTVVKAADESGNILGGYTEATWNASPEGPFCYKEDADAFLFSLANRENTPVKVNIAIGKVKHAIIVSNDYGPIFGNCEFFINLDKFNEKESSCRIGSTFKLPKFSHLSNDLQRNFKIEEIEVFKLQ